MSSSGASGFVGVIKLVNCYVAVRVENQKKQFISKHPEEDRKTAETTAKVFAETHGIPYMARLLQSDRAIMTVFKVDEQWFPAELHSDRVNVLKQLGFVSLGGSQQEAVSLARAIARNRRQDCLPNIGISLEESKGRVGDKDLV